METRIASGVVDRVVDLNLRNVGQEKCDSPFTEPRGYEGKGGSKRNEKSRHKEEY